MKLMSGRRYKNDLSDIADILWEHEKTGKPISREAVDRAIGVLYGGWAAIPLGSQKLIQTAFESGDYEKLYFSSLENERQSKEILLNFDRSYPNTLNEDNISTIIEKAKRQIEKEVCDSTQAYRCSP